MRQFEYKQPGTIELASGLLREAGENSIPMGGGTDLLGLLKNRTINPAQVVNLKRLPGMREITYAKGSGLRIGALVTISELAAAEFPDEYQVLREAAREIASPQLRTVGTVAGNLCQRPRCWYFRSDFNCLRKGGDICYAVGGENKRHCIIGGGPCYIVHPSDLAVALLTLDATVEIYSTGKKRDVPIHDFYVLPEEDFTVENILDPGEIITGISVPVLPQKTVSRYIKVKERNVWDFAVVSIAGVIQRTGTGYSAGKLAFGGVAPVPWEDTGAGGAISGIPFRESAYENVAAQSLQEASPLEENGYKLILARNLVKKMLRELAP